MGKKDSDEEDKGAIELGEKKAAKDKAKAPEDIPYEEKGPLARFLSGPYFKVIPSKYEAVARGMYQKHTAAEDAGGDGSADTAAADGSKQEDYLQILKKLIVRPVDVDGVYGLTADELVPLPFDVPKWHEYLVDILSGLYLVGQATIVMFIAINVENQDRIWKSGRSYSDHWLPLIRSLIILYPLCTLLILMSVTLEFSLRKFMYYRLLSMRVLVDWENRKPWNTGFFYYFVITWTLMNAWAIFGVAKYYNKNGNNGLDPVSFGAFVVINLQTIQLLIFYNRLIASESRLVALNQLFERAPVEAQRLLTYTYVVEESDLVDECYIFAVGSERAFLARVANVLTCCRTFTDWRKDTEKLRFDLDRLKRRAPNYHEVERNTAKLKLEIEASHTLTGGMTGPHDGDGSHDGKHKDEKHHEEKHKKHDKDEKEAAPEVQAVEVVVNAPLPNSIEPELGPDGRPVVNLPLPMCNIFGWSPLRWFYGKFYGSSHCLVVTLMLHCHSWPFRLDVIYFRWLSSVQVCSWFACGAVVVFGWFYATQETTCAKNGKSCETCLKVHERYWNSLEPTCATLEYAVTTIVNTTLGTYNNDGVIAQRYPLFECTGNFTTPYQLPHP